jgi:hypothetical protein
MATLPHAVPGKRKRTIRCSSRNQSSYETCNAWRLWSTGPEEGKGETMVNQVTKQRRVKHKPRIIFMRGSYGLWDCRCNLANGVGNTPAEAYQYWLKDFDERINGSIIMAKASGDQEAKKTEFKPTRINSHAMMKHGINNGRIISDHPDGEQFIIDLIRLMNQYGLTKANGCCDSFYFHNDDDQGVGFEDGIDFDEMLKAIRPGARNKGESINSLFQGFDGFDWLQK